ncbi:MAG: C40 family peptidase [Bacilli bacterium]|nr:C40 family peptidase [Bacilli bacterium]
MKNERCKIKNIILLNKKIVKILLLIIGISLTTGFYYDNNIYIDLEEITVELGDSIPQEKINYINTLLSGSNHTVEDNVPKNEAGYTTKTGTYEYYIVYDDKDRKYSKITNQKSKINVVDTTKPLISLKKDKYTYNYGSKINVKDIAVCFDYSECNLEFEEKINTNKSGEQNAIIIATDKHGNQNKINVKINIKKKVVNSSNNGSSSYNKINEKNNTLNNSLSEKDKENLRYQIIEFAKKFVGNPYVYGGTSLTKGTDCSGFTQSVYANFGYSLPRSALSQGNIGKKVSYSELKPGDLIVYRYSNGGGHVGMFIGNGKMIHAGTAKTGIVIANIFSGNRTYRRVIY